MQWGESFATGCNNWTCIIPNCQKKGWKNWKNVRKVYQTLTFDSLALILFYSNFVERPTYKTKNEENIGCGGGKFYTGFTEMPERVPTFVSLKEKYKKTPQMVIDFVEQIGVSRTEKKYLHFARIDKVKSFEEVEGIVFLANPDMLSGLTTWAFYDNNAEDCVVSTFGSGCSSVVTQATIENRKGGKRTFIGFFDPSVRPYFEADKLSYTIPMSRFKEMYLTMRQSCLFDTHAWGKIRERMDAE